MVINKTWFENRSLHATSIYLTEPKHISYLLSMHCENSTGNKGGILISNRIFNGYLQLVKYFYEATQK